MILLLSFLVYFQLLKLQQKIGLDDRFKLDERFLEEESDEDRTIEPSVKKIDSSNKPANRVTDNASGDTISKQLKEEKERSLAILQQILGGNVLFSASKFSSSEKTYVRFMLLCGFWRKLE